MTATLLAHNSSPDRLRAIFSRLDNLDEEAKALTDDRAEFFKEVANEGWNVKAIKAVQAERRAIARNPVGHATLASEIEMYRSIVGTDGATRGRPREAA